MPPRGRPLRVVVVGAGIIGSGAALALARDGHDVTVVDRAAPGGVASAASFGWLNASYAETDAYFELRAQAMRRWEALGLARMTGALWYEEAGEAFERYVADLAARGHPHEVVGPDRIAEIEPELRDLPPRAVHTPDEGAVDADVAARALLSRAMAEGARLRQGAGVTGFVVVGGRVRGVETAAGDIEGDVVVCAAGAVVEKLLDTLGLTLPMANAQGLIVRTRPVPPMLRGIVMTPDIHMRQSADGGLVVGEIFSGGRPQGADPDDFADQLMTRVRQRLPAAAAEVATVHTAVRPMPRDGFPAIGWMDEAQGLYMMSMHSGATLAPLVGELAAEEIAGGTSPLLSTFRPDRFAEPAHRMAGE